MPTHASLEVRRTLVALNAMRFPAILLVFISHAIAATTGGDVTEAIGLRGVFYEAMGAVVFFLMLSGFIITYVYRDRIHDATLKAATRFAAARFTRFWPVHGLILGITALFAFGPSGIGSGDTVGFIEHMLLLQAWDPSRTLAFNSPAWTLSVELFAALLLVYVIAAIKRFSIADSTGRLTVIMLGLWAFSISSVLAMELLFTTKTAQMVAFTSPLNHAPVPLIGACLAFVVFGISGASSRISRFTYHTWTTLELVAIFGVIGSVMLRNIVPEELTILRYGPLHVPAAALFIWVFAHDGGAISRMCRTPALGWLGHISFAFYLCHVLVLKLLAAFGLAQILHPLLFGGISLLVSIGFAHVLRCEVEIPAQRALRRRYERQRTSAVPDLGCDEPAASRENLSPPDDKAA
jgi:peptidoglycan/LPS O-acetylase OafA/YrhL